MYKIIPIKKPLIKNHNNIFNKKISKKQINQINNYKKIFVEKYYNIPIEELNEVIYISFKTNIKQLSENKPKPERTQS